MVAEALVPYKYPVSLDGTAFMVDTAMRDQWRHETVPLLRQQADQSSSPGEQSINPEGEWRRSWETWHKGAGQASRDRDDSSPFRFLSSVGLDIWDRYSIHLHVASDDKRASSNTNLKLIPVGDRLFLIDGADVVYTTDISPSSPTWTACTNEPGGTILDAASDGKHIWITDGSNSYWADAAASPPAFNLAGWTGTQDADVLGFVKGRLLSGDNSTGTVHYYDAAGAATAITVAANLPSNWTWVGFAGGPSTPVIYVAGYAGDKSTIFRIGINANGTTLDPAIPAGELPDGEIARSIESYLGFVLIGTDKGVRFATPDSTGNLTIGALLATGSPCYCFEGQGPYVWFGWDNFDGTHGGLGRLSLEEFSSADRLAPAYATDLNASAIGTTKSVATFQNRRIWATTGTSLGVYAQHDLPAARSGTITFSDTDFGVPDEKIVVGIDFQSYAAGTGVKVSGTLTPDKGSPVSFGDIESTNNGSTSISLANVRGSRFTLVLNWSAHTTTFPDLTIYRVTLRAIPAVPSTRLIQVPLLLSQSEDPDGGVVDSDVEDRIAEIEALWNSRDPVAYQEIDRTYTVTVEDFTLLPTLGGDEVKTWAVDATCLVKLKELSS